MAVGLSALGSADAQGWSARRKPEPRTKAPAGQRKVPSRGRSKPAKGETTKAQTAKLPLAERVERLLARRAPLPVDDALALLRLAVARREMSQAMALAEAILRARRADAAQLLEAATTLGGGQKIPVQRKLLARAHASRGAPPFLRPRIAEAYFDALIAADEVAQARKLLQNSLLRTPAGQRRGLLERLVAWGRLHGDSEAILHELIGWRDPDAAVLAARLADEQDGAGAGTTILRKQWRRFPAHRQLQAAYIKSLARLGKRGELEQVVARIVRLSPSDPMPWLEVVDAHIVARDPAAARKRIDTLVKRYARDPLLLEALIDREQRMPAARGRMARLFDALLAAAPRDPQHIEAYGEWLLAETPGRQGQNKAIAVLQRLRDLPGRRFDGLRRMAAILQTHGHVVDAEQLLKQMAKEFPKRPETSRLMAILYAQTGRKEAAEARWIQLSALPVGPSADQRQQAAEARRNLIALYRGGDGAEQKIAALLARPQGAAATLGDTLLALEAQIHLRGLVASASSALWRDGSHPALRRWQDDVEVMAYRAQDMIRAGERAAVLAVLERLDDLDPEVAQPLLIALVKVALAAADGALAERAEARLRGPRHGSPSLLLRLGEVHLRQGDTKGASQLFRRAAAASPGDTRATARLAQMLRQTGASDQEAEVLRDIILRTVDADELELAGQRLLTLAMARGHSADLLRWLEAITPQHPRRAILDRFRLQAYDVWLRGEVLERNLGTRSGPEPGPTMLSEALASADLAVRVRALRQAARRGQALAPSVARRLMKDTSAVVRRDTAMALAATGRLQDAQLLVEMDDSDTPEVTAAQLLALGRLPRVEGGEPFLVGQLKRHRDHRADLAALALGRVGDRTALAAVIERLGSPAVTRRAALLIAAGDLLGRFPDAEGAALAMDILAQHADAGAARGRSVRDRLEAMAALWGLAAAASPQARDHLLDVAVESDNGVLRAMAIRLAGAERPPRLTSKLWHMELNWQRWLEFSTTLLRRVVMTWLEPDEVAMGAALTKIEAPLLQRAQRQFASGPEAEQRRRWCLGLGLGLERAAKLAKWCGQGPAGWTGGPS